MYRSRSRDRIAPAPRPSYMTSQQMADYLSDLRSHRIPRPNGSRPLPSSSMPSLRNASKISQATEPSSESRPSPPLPASPPLDAPAQCPKPQSQHRSNPFMRHSPSTSSGLGRPLVPEPSPKAIVPEPADNVPYIENGQRWMERQEAHSIRMAMEDMALNEEHRIYTAARDEAAELVWKHQNPSAPYRSPETAYKYREHLEKGSHNRSNSLDRSSQDLQQGASESNGHRQSFSGRPASGGDQQDAAQKTCSPTNSSPKLSQKPMQTARGPPELPGSAAPGRSQQRRRSSGSRRRASGSLFRNPEDQIYEEPEEENSPPAPKPAEVKSPAPLPLQVRRNPFTRAQMARGGLNRANTDPVQASKKFDRFEIQKNPPTQSRNPEYTSNPLPLTPQTTPPAGNDLDDQNVDPVKVKDGKEIRSDEIRAATSMRRKDRSPKLPTPTLVSDSPGRPIVSFEEPKEIELKEEQSQDLPPTPLPPAPDSGRSAKNAPDASTLNSRVSERTASIHTSPSPSGTKADRISVSSSSSSSIPKPSRIPSVAVEPAPSTEGPKEGSRLPPKRSFHRETARSMLEKQGPPVPLHATDSAGFKPAKDMPPIPSIHVRDSPPAVPIKQKPIPSVTIADAPCAPVSSTKKTPPIPSITVGTDKPLPSINVKEVPSINVNNTPAPPSVNVQSPPSISVSSAPIPTINAPSNSTSRPLPSPTKESNRAFPRHSAAGGTGSRSHWTPTVRRTTALCTQCGLPISGRIVSAANVRFHPECFTCYQCGEGLECIAFYPEPEAKRVERVDRIRRRMNGEEVETGEGISEADDGDESVRFYCHLDYHELFSPRCKSCKTPIEGEVVIACGAEWHVGHFFCAQCGDPFDSDTPFVEKDGYAWCVGCHTNRYSNKCRKCKRPVTDMVVKALNAEWHAQCFCCTSCGGQFDDGRYFLRQGSQDPVCVKCEEIRLKA